MCATRAGILRPRMRPRSWTESKVAFPRTGRGGEGKGMSNRRDFISGTTAFAALMFRNNRVATAENVVSTASRSLRILILGATGYIGPHFIQAALARGHQVSIFTRGKAPAALTGGVETLI